MNIKVISFIKNISYAFVSNLISLFVSTLVILIIPKLIGVEEYGYWQLYLFYSSYVGFLHLGWNDGIYLRYGGKNYKELDKNLFFSQFIMLMISQLVIATIIIVLSMCLIIDIEKNFIFKMLGFVLVITNSRYMLLYILQATNRIKEYARITIIDRIIYIAIIILLLLNGIKNYELLIVSDILGKIISLIYAMYCCKDIVFRKLSLLKFTLNETFININIGIKLMFANIASMLIIGTARFGIERTWDVVTFGKVSLTLSISNMTMLFINAIGIIMFPILRRTNRDKLSSIYKLVRDFLMVLLLAILIIYYPIKVLMLQWLPQYTESLRYMALVFPMLIFEGKMSLLINTYLKTLRKEKIILKVNIISLLLSVVLTIVSVIMFKNLNFAIINIVILLAFRSILAELCLSKILSITVLKDIILEIMMTIIFILSGWFINSWYTLFIYSIAYIIYIIIKKKDIYVMFITIKSIIKV